MGTIPQKTYNVTFVTDDETNVVVTKIWRDQDSNLSCPDGPALQRFDAKTGNRLLCEYFVDGIRHRPEEEGPAVQEWNAETGNIEYEQYSEAGVGHRSGKKPAIIHYDPHTGNITEQYYLENGVDINPHTGEKIWEYPESGCFSTNSL